MIYLHKILPFFLSPLGIIIIFLLISFFYKRKVFVSLAFLVLIISSNSFVGNYLVGKLEQPYKPKSIKSLKKHDAIIVLSAGVKKIGTGENIIYEFADLDRFFSGLELKKNHKANLLIFTAGQVPWTKYFKPEGVILKEKAVSLGIGEAQIKVTKEAKNTYEESIVLLELLPKNSSILLVTSAFHMNRSKYLFDKQGFVVTPFPVDFKSSNLKFSILNILPNLNSLYKTSLFIRENIGRIYYKIVF